MSNKNNQGSPPSTKSEPLKSKTGLPASEVVLPAAMIMLDETISLLVDYELDFDDAVALVRDAYVRAQLRKHSDKSIRELCGESENQTTPAVLPFSRTTVARIRSKANGLLEGGFLLQLEQELRFHARKPRSKDQLHDLTRRKQTFARFDDADFKKLFEQAFKNLCQREQLVEEDSLWRHTHPYLYRTTEAVDKRWRETFVEHLEPRILQACTSGEKSKHDLRGELRPLSAYTLLTDDEFDLHFEAALESLEGAAKLQHNRGGDRPSTHEGTLLSIPKDVKVPHQNDEARKEQDDLLMSRLRSLELDDIRINTDLAGRISRQLGETLRMRFFDYRLGVRSERTPETGYQAFSFSSLESQKTFIDKMFSTTIEPAILAINAVADGGKELVETGTLPGSEVRAEGSKLMKAYLELREWRKKFVDQLEESTVGPLLEAVDKARGADRDVSEQEIHTLKITWMWGPQDPPPVPKQPKKDED